MTPESAGIHLVAEVIARLGTAPILLFLALLTIGPWFVLGFVVWVVEKKTASRFEAVVEMYENNVLLVKNYEGITNNLQDLVLITGQTMQKLVDTSEKNTELMTAMIKGNTFCPIVRQRTGPGTIEEGGGR